MSILEKKANDLLQNIFYFDRPWDMEQDLRPIQMESIDWSFKKKDSEWTYMLNRMEYIVDLSIYALISKNKKYSDKVEDLISDWIDKNNLNDDYHRTLDTGIRLLTWSFVLNKNVNPSPKIIKSIKEQVKYLMNNYRLKDDLSNWGLLQSIGVLSCSEYLEINVINWWIEKLFIQLNLQITDEGSHWENSIMYHNQILNGLCRLQDITNNLELVEYIDRLALYTYKTCKPNYHQVQQNDSDDTDVSGLLGYAYSITQNDTYKFELIDKRLNVLCMNENVIKPKLEKVVKLYEIAGMSVYRKDSIYMSAHNQPYGSSHSHLMWGHVNFFSDGNILIDPGRNTYLDNNVRKELKSIKSHNCVYNINRYRENIINSWDSNVNSYAISTEKYSNKNIDVTIMNYSVNEQNNTRYVIVINEQLLIFDKVAKGCNDLVEANLIFSPEINFDGLILKSRDYQVIHNYKEYNYEKQIYSPRYNQLEETTKLCFKSSQDEIIYYQGLLKLNCEFNQVYSDENSKAFNIKSEVMDYIIYLCPIEIKIGTKVKSVCDYSVYGRLMIIDRSTGEKYSIKL